MKPNLYLVGMVLMFFSIPAYPQQHKELSLSQAWELAAKDYPTLKEQNAKLQEAQYRKQELQSLALPQVQAQFQNSYGTYAGSSGAFFPTPGVFNVNGGNASASTITHKTTMNSFGSVTVDWKLSQFGKQRKVVEAAETQVAAAKSGYEASLLSLRTKVTRRYLNMMYSDAGLSWSKENVSRVKEVLDLAKSLSEAGLKPGADTALASAAYYQAMAHQEEWQGKYDAGRINFKEVVPSMDATTQLPVTAFMKDATIPVNTENVPSAHPYLQVLHQKVAGHEAEEQVASRKTLPAISLLAGLSSRGSGINPDGTVYRDFPAGFDNRANNYLVGVGLSWNLSNIYTGSLEKRKINKQVEVAKAGYDFQQLQMNTAYQSLSSKIAAQFKQMGKTEQALSQTLKAYDLYLSRYEAGLINLTELLQLQSLLQQVEKRNIEVHQELWDQLTEQAEVSGNFEPLFNQFK